MQPQTLGRVYDVGKIAPVQCIRDDLLLDLNIKDHCFLLLIAYKGSAYFKVGDVSFDAIAPCFVCFDEQNSPVLLQKSDFHCDAVYFHPKFLNVNMSFENLRGKRYQELVLAHDLFLLRPFTDPKAFVFPLFEDWLDRVRGLFEGLQEELLTQSDWYWSCRSRSFFIELILLLERTYGIITHSETGVPAVNHVQNPHLQSAVSFIETHYHETVTLEEITRAASMNHSTLTALFKAELQVTPIEFLWRYRIMVAKKQLEFTNLPIKDIALRCGFKTVQHFSRKFEAAIGSPPAAFRESAVAERKKSFLLH